MTLHDRMVYAGIRTSRKIERLSWFERDFFLGLILVADDFGRFEADAEMLRTVLYGLLIAKVSVRDVEGALVACHEAGLVKLYRSGGRGYGKVINFRQKLTKRRALYPDEEGPPGDTELFTTAPPPPIPIIQKEGRKGGRAERATPTPESQELWLERMQQVHPEIDVPAQLRLAKRNRERAGKKLDRVWFERHWLSHTGREVTFDGDTLGSEVTTEAEPEAWRAYLKDRYGAEDWAATAAIYTWEQLPTNWRTKIAREMGQPGR